MKHPMGVYCLDRIDGECPGHPMNSQELLKSWGFQDPDEIRQSEYRAIFDTLADGLASAEPDEDKADLALAILDEFSGWPDPLRVKVLAAQAKADALPLVGKTALVRFGRLVIPCHIIQAEARPIGGTLFLAEPVGGMGRVWVEQERIGYECLRRRCL